MMRETVLGTVGKMLDQLRHKILKELRVLPPPPPRPHPCTAEESREKKVGALPTKTNPNELDF
jgi:hypothetical protein